MGRFMARSTWFGKCMQTYGVGLVDSSGSRNGESQKSYPAVKVPPYREEGCVLNVSI